MKAYCNVDIGITHLLQLLITVNFCSNFIAWLSCLIFTYIYLILPVYNVQNAYMCKLRKELPPINLAAVTCDSCSGMTGKLVPGSIIVCSMGSSTARGVKITGVCRSPALPDGVGRRRLAALSGLPHSVAPRQIFFWLVLYRGCKIPTFAWPWKINFKILAPLIFSEMY